MNMPVFDMNIISRTSDRRVRPDIHQQSQAGMRQGVLDLPGMGPSHFAVPSAKQQYFPIHAGDDTNFHSAADTKRCAASSERAQDPGPVLLAPGRYFPVWLHLLRLFCLNL